MIEYYNAAGSKIGELYPTSLPSVKEELNAGYTTSIEILAQDIAKIGGWFSRAKIGGQLFVMSGRSPSRGVGVESMSLNLEHVSYELNGQKDATADYEGNADYMVRSILKAQTGFSVGRVDPTSIKYYKPSHDGVRKRLIDVANLFDLELQWDNTTVNLIKRDRKPGIVIEEGKNLIEFSGNHTIDRENGNALEEGYDVETIADVQLGDTVTVRSARLGIDYTNRITSIEFMPDKPLVKKIRVGQKERDLTDYIKDQDRWLGIDWLREFKVGKKDCLSIPGLDVTESYRKHVKDGSVLKVEAKVFVSDIKTLKGLKLLKVKDFEQMYINIFEDGRRYTEADITHMGSKFYPDKEFGELVIVMTREDFTEKPNLDLDMKVYAVKFAIDEKLPDETDTLEDYLSELKVGGKDILFTPGTDMTTDYKKALRHNSLKPLPKSTLFVPNLEALKGLIAKKTNAKKGHHVAAFEDGRRLTDAEMRDGKFPKKECSDITAVVSDKPYDELTYADDFKAYGAKVCVDPTAEPEPEPGDTPVSGNMVMEYINAPYQARTVYEFSRPYPEVVSILAGYIGMIGGDDLYCEPVLDAANRQFIGVKLHTPYSVPAGAKITIQAICKKT